MLFNFVIERRVGKIGAVGAVHRVAPMAARPQVFAVGREGESAGPHHFAACSGSVHASQTACDRSIVNARDSDFIRFVFWRLIFCWHFSFLSQFFLQ